MAIPRITPYPRETDDLDAAEAFYAGLLGLEVSMRDHHDGRFLGLRSPDEPSAQLVISRPVAGAPAPELGIDVGEPSAVDAIHAEAVRRGHAVLYGPITEPWGVRRCFVEDPAGTIVSVLAHG